MSRQKIKREPPEETLRAIAEKAIEKHFDNVRTPLIRAVGGESFYNLFCKGRENMFKLLEKIRDLDSERYGHLYYEPFNKKKSDKNHHLEENERDIITETLLELDEKHPLDSGRMPTGSRLEVCKRLKSAGYNRSDDSTYYHMRAIWNGQYPCSDGHIPLRMRRTSKKLGITIDNKINDLEKSEPTIISSISGDKKERKKRRFNLKRNVPLGHQKLIAYMMDPENYQVFFGEGSNLIAVDFRETDTDSKLYEAFKKKLDCIEDAVEDQELIEFVDGWLRCDMIFKRANGVYAIAEIKQNAIDTKQYSNAQKALQQIGAYTGAAEEVVRLIDFNNKNNPEHQVLKNPVEGYLVAYTIQPDLLLYLTMTEARGAFVLERTKVDQYIEKAIGK